MIWRRELLENKINFSGAKQIYKEGLLLSRLFEPLPDDLVAGG